MVISLPECWKGKQVLRKLVSLSRLVQRVRFQRCRQFVACQSCLVPFPFWTGLTGTPKGAHRFGATLCVCTYPLHRFWDPISFGVPMPAVAPFCRCLRGLMKQSKQHTECSYSLLTGGLRNPFHHLLKNMVLLFPAGLKGNPSPEKMSLFVPKGLINIVCFFGFCCFSWGPLNIVFAVGT